MSTLNQDHFTGTNGTDLQFHTPDVGGAWTAAEGVIVIQSNKANGASGNNAHIEYYTINSAVADVVVTADFDVPALLHSFGSLVVRTVNKDNAWLMSFEDDTLGLSPYIVIYERTSGVQNTRASANISAVGGTTVTMTATANGTSLSLAFGSGSISYTSSVRQTTTTHGISTYYDGTYTTIPIDDFLVTTIPTGSIFGRKTLSPIGTRVGSRQTHQGS